MKLGILFYSVLAIAFIIIVFVVMFGMRWFNAQTVQHNIIQPKDGVECVVVTTTDGAAVDCWRKQQ